MKFETLIHGKLIKRYKRFLADIILDNGEEITAHVPNSGAMTSCIEENCDVWVTFHDDVKRKLEGTKTPNGTIIKDGKNIGQIDIDSHKLNPFTDEDRALLEWLCNELARIL